MIRQLCVLCDGPTGRCAEDSIWHGDDIGPLCEECHDDHKCSACYGEGDVNELVNRAGHVDYVDGSPSGRKVMCSVCNGKGYWE